MLRRFSPAVCLVSLLCACSAPTGSEAESTGVALEAAAEIPVLAAPVLTPPLHGYDDAPRAVDSDDPAIWIHPKKKGEGFVIGALKNAGLQVYDLRGKVVQTIVPPSRPPVSAEDPSVPGPQPDPGTGPCADSESGETFGRFNNVDIQYDVPLKLASGRRTKVDVAVVTDRGCDRLRFYSIDPERAGGPLVEITAPDAPRVFPKRFVQPSPVQSPGQSSALVDNDLDEQSTAYGVTLYRASDNDLRAFVTQRRRAVIGEFRVVSAQNGALSYQKVREYRFNPVFRISAPGSRHRELSWTPCREEAAEDPQFEGLAVDQERGVLYASQEVVGVWRLPLDDRQPSVVTVSPSKLMERTRSFGAPFWAIPDDDEFECADEAPEDSEDVIAAPGNPDAGGKFLAADVEGQAIYYRKHGKGYLLISSQGDDTFHVFDREVPNRHMASFQFEGVGETDGHDVVNAPMGKSFPYGLFALQNGKAPAPESEDDVNGYEYDNSTQFELIGWDAIAGALDIDIDTDAFDPRKGH